LQHVSSHFGGGGDGGGCGGGGDGGGFGAGDKPPTHAL
jgi:hypothetical protein